MRIDKRKRERSARNKFPFQLRNEVVHLLERRVRENGVRKDDVELWSKVRNRKIGDAVGVERTVVAIVMGPVRFGKRAAAVVDSLFDHVEAIIILPLNRARRIEQDASPIPAKIKDELASPIWMTELLVEIRELRRLHRLRA